LKRNKIFILSTILIVTILTGCWDRMSIDRRAFVLAIGIDKFIFDEEKDDPNLNTHWTKFRVAFSIPNLPKLVGQQGVTEEPRYAKVSTGPTFSNTYKGLEGRINKTIYFGHTKAIVLGDELLKDKALFKEVLDIFLRNSEFSRSIPIVAIDGAAEDVVKVHPDMQPMIGMHITQLFENNQGETIRFEEKTLGELIKSLQEDKMAIIPQIHLGEKDIKIAGAAIIKDYELAGWLDDRQIKGILWIKKKNRRLEVSAPYKDFHVAYHVSSAKSKIRFNEDNGKLSCNIIIEAEGNLDEYILDESALDNKEIKKIEMAFEKVIKEEIRNSLRVLQEEYKADVIEIGKELERQDYKRWNKVKDNWEEEFQEMDFIIDIHVKIRRIGQAK